MNRRNIIPRDRMYIVKFRRHNSLFSFVRIPVSDFNFTLGIEPKTPQWTSLNTLIKRDDADAGISFSFSDSRKGYPLGITIANHMVRNTYPEELYKSFVFDDLTIRDPEQLKVLGSIKVGEQFHGAKNVLSSYPLLVRNGRVDYGGFNPFNLRIPINGRHPRTALGITEDKSKVMLVACDGRGNVGSAGVTIPQLAETMVYLGAHDALAGDGGGVIKLMVRRLDGNGWWTLTRSHDPGRPIVTAVLAKMSESRT